MLRITTHIERLLLVHDCVIVPKLGGFVLQTVSTDYREEEHMFHPVRKEIVFNTTLQHNDGLLSESYMQTYHMDYRKAQSMLEEDIQQLRASFQEQKKVLMGKIGSFTLGDEGQLIYSPGETELFSVSSYGLPAFHFPVLQPMQTEREETKLLTDKKKKDILYIPVSRKLIRVVAASAAAIAMFFLISTPVKDVNQAAYTASFIPSELVSYKPVAEVKATETPETTISSEKATPKPLPVPKVSAEKKEVEKLTISPPPKSSNAKSYHIIIASFPSEAQANDYISNIDRNVCKHVSKVARNGKYRIYADKFDNREAAESYMATLRKTEKYKDAWLFISR